MKVQKISQISSQSKGTPITPLPQSEGTSFIHYPAPCYCIEWSTKKNKSKTKSWKLKKRNQKVATIGNVQNYSTVGTVPAYW